MSDDNKRTDPDLAKGLVRITGPKDSYLLDLASFQMMVQTTGPLPDGWVYEFGGKE